MHSYGAGVIISRPPQPKTQTSFLHFFLSKPDQTGLDRYLYFFVQMEILRTVICRQQNEEENSRIETEIVGQWET